MTAREAAGDATRLHRRLDEVLDGEDAIIVLIDRHTATSFFHGFAASGCQLELIGHQLDAALHRLSQKVGGE